MVDVVGLLVTLVLFLVMNMVWVAVLPKVDVLPAPPLVHELATKVHVKAKMIAMVVIVRGIIHHEIVVHLMNRHVLALQGAVSITIIVIITMMVVEMVRHVELFLDTDASMIV